MPQLDLALVRSQLAKGRKHSDIAKELGVTRSAISNALRRERLSTQFAAAGRAIADGNLSAAAPLFLAAMSNDCQETLGRVRNRRAPQSNEKELIRESVLEKLNRRARATYGLDREVSQSVKVGLSINITKPPLDSEQVIEVQGQVSNECRSSSTPEEPAKGE